MIAESLVQILAVIRLEMRKTFFARRGLWVYLLAFAPVVLYMGNSIYAPRERARLVRLAAAHPVAGEALDAIERGAAHDQVIARLGQPYAKSSEQRHFGNRIVQRQVNRYTDGRRDFTLLFFDGWLRRIEVSDPGNLPQDTLIFATIFQFYYLRLAVFFGCVGIFMNLFRGELLDKSLHFYLLTPVRRELLVFAKYLAGLGATVVIFTTSTALQLVALLWQYDRGEVAHYLQASGWQHIAAYLGVTALACVGYGSIFLAAGLLFRNPIIPTVLVLLWESANLFLPVTLKKLSLIFYLQSLCPTATPTFPDMPAALSALIALTTPASISAALTIIILLTIFFLLVAGRQARKLEINYSTD